MNASLYFLPSAKLQSGGWASHFCGSLASNQPQIMTRAKAAHTRKAKQTIYYFPQQVGVQPSLAKEESIMPNGDLGRETPKLWMLLLYSPGLLLLSPALIAVRLSYDVRYSFVPLGSALPDVSSPSSLCTPSLFSGGVVWGAEKSLTVQVLVSNDLNIPLLSTLFWSQIQHIASYQLL